MKTIKFACPAFILVGALALSTSTSFGKVEYTKTTKKSCVTCHVSAKSKELNAVGKCFGEKKKLEGCEVNSDAKATEKK